MKISALFCFLFFASINLSCGTAPKSNSSETKFQKTTWYCKAESNDEQIIAEEWVHACFDRLCAERKIRTKFPDSNHVLCL